MPYQHYLIYPHWPVLYSDNHLLLLYKPAGLPVQGDESGDISLLDIGKKWIKEKYHKPGNVFLAMVHRLDRPVAGLVLFCRTSKAAARISEQFRGRQVEKTYLAVVAGKVRNRAGTLRHYLQKIPGRSSRILRHPVKSSAEAVLHYKRQGIAGDNSLLEIRLETGRHHQIRAQLSHMGYPILGDLRYGASSPLPQKQIALLASGLEIRHPVKKKKMRFVSPLPLGWPWEKEGEGESIFWNRSDIGDSFPT